MKKKIKYINKLSTRGCNCKVCTVLSRQFDTNPYRNALEKIARLPIDHPNYECIDIIKEIAMEALDETKNSKSKD